MENFNYERELEIAFKKYIFDNETNHEKEIILNALGKIVDDKKRIIGFLRFQGIKEKLIQCLSQSYEIKTGYILEDFFEKLIARKFHNLPKSIQGYKCDQLFDDENNIYLIEQKIRDDHDSSKKDGQMNNFNGKLQAIKNVYGATNKTIKSYVWFIDDNFAKYKSYYLQELAKINDATIVAKELHYGRTLIDMLFNSPTIWDNFVDMFTQVKLRYTSNLSQTVNQYDFDADPQGYIFNVLIRKRSNKLKDLFFGEDYSEVRTVLFPNNIMKNKIREYFAEKSTPDRLKFVNCFNG